jgi:hypothetical protein
MIPVKVDRNKNAPIPPPQKTFKYVDQGNYIIIPFDNPQGISTIYSDSATSCIIVIAVGILISGKNGVSLAHLDSPECINKFVELLKGNYRSEVQIYAQGANPKDNTVSQKNASALKDALKAAGSLIVEQQLFLLEGDPRENNRGDWGINLEGDNNATVTNQPYILELTDRDPACGGQSIYCILRRQETPPVQLRNALLPFTLNELVELVKLALVYQKDKSDPKTAFTNIINMQNKEILETWSTTPEYEAPWFSDQLKQASCFALSMSPVTRMCDQYLLDGFEIYERLRIKLLKTGKD